MPKPKDQGEKIVTDESQLTPQMYDGIIFYPTLNQVYFEFFTFKGKRTVHKEDERIPCHVSLYSIRNNKVELFETFQAHFDDPREYCDMLRKQTQMFGIVIRDVKKAQSFIKDWKVNGLELMTSLIQDRMKEEHQQIPLWIRIKMWFGWKPREEEQHG